MTLTSDYTRLHLALRRVAGRNALAGGTHPLRPFDVRLLLAVHERGDEVDTATLADDLGLRDGATVRRALADLADAGYATTRGIDGGPTRPGTRSVAVLTTAGRDVADDALQASAPPEFHAAAARLRQEHAA